MISFTHFALALFASLIPPGTPSARVYFLNVGQGDATLIVSPTGKTMLVDAGFDGSGKGVVLPLLSQLGIKRLDYMVATHYHPDHVGGLDEVATGGFLPGQALDRGDTKIPGYYSQVKGYLAAIVSVRKTITPGRVIDLGGGMTARCVAVGGAVQNGPTISFSGKNQEENGRSIVLKVSFGGFDLWLGGDLTGGASGTADVESYAALSCGDVDVYQANHHGSTTSSTSGFLARIKPEVTVFSAGANNPYGHPNAQVISRISPAYGVRMLLGTTVGTGANGPIPLGTIALETDGFRYRLHGGGGKWEQWLAVDGAPGKAPVVGQLKISEFHRQPGTSATLGEYIEWTHTGAETLDMHGLRIYSSTASGIVLDFHLLLEPGQFLLAGGGGDGAKNGGYLPAFTWPTGALSLADTSGYLTLSPGERVGYSATFPGGRGFAAERRDLLAPPGPASFGASLNRFGFQDFGSPAWRNSPDQTKYGVNLAITSPFTPGTRLRFSLYAPNHVANYHVICLAGSSTPGFWFGGFHIPLNIDAIFTTGLLIPGLVDYIPASGRADLVFPVPVNPILSGLKCHGAAVLLDPFQGYGVTGVSPALPFSFP